MHFKFNPSLAWYQKCVRVLCTWQCDRDKVKWKVNSLNCLLLKHIYYVNFTRSHADGIHCLPLPKPGKGLEDETWGKSTSEQTVYSLQKPKIFKDIICNLRSVSLVTEEELCAYFLNQKCSLMISYYRKTIFPYFFFKTSFAGYTKQHSD